MSIRKATQNDRNAMNEGVGGLDDSAQSQSEHLIIIEMNEDVISRKMMLYCLQFVYTGSCKVKLSETGDLAQIANGLLLDELGSFCGNMQTFANQIDECKVMNASITTYWLDSCAELYKEVLLDREYKYDITIHTKSTINVDADNLDAKEQEVNVLNEDQKEQKEEQKENPQDLPNENAPDEVNEAAAVGRLIYQTPDAQIEDHDKPTLEGDVADIPVAAPQIEAGPGNGNDNGDGNGVANEDVDAKVDIAPVVNVGEFRAHKVIPWSRCDVFQAMLNHNYQESNDSTVTFNDVRSKTFGGLVPFLFY